MSYDNPCVLKVRTRRANARASRIAPASVILAVLAITGVAGRVGATDFSPQALEFFEKEVRPLLAAKCFECHGKGKKLEGGLQLTTHAGLLKGGESGAVVRPGKPNESPLVRAVRYDGDVQMPPDGKLSDPQVASLVRWVELGAPWPEESDAAPVNQPAGRNLAAISDEQRAFWSFQAVKQSPVPAVQNRAWVRSEIDAFVVAKLEAEGLAPAPPADKRTLLRRATFDLIGLPPTPDEADAFLADDSPQAFAKVVDRLLASAHYGEQWGRHWLDVARYADSSGKDENHACASAFRYRDYVVAALNKDKPFDRFVREQIAGDLLPARGPVERYENLTATGFLQLGPKALAEQDKPKLLMDIADEQIDSVSKAFLGLTVACGRCHDHKLEPVPQRDYYALAGIFRSTRVMQDLAFVSEWQEVPLAEPAAVELVAAHQREVEQNKKEIEERVKRAQKDVEAAWQNDFVRWHDELPKTPQDKLRRILYGTKCRLTPPADAREYYAVDDLAALQTLESRRDALKASAPPPIPTAMAVTEGEISDTAINIRGNHLNLGEKVPRGFLQITPLPGVTSIPAGHSGRLELADWIARADHPLTGRVIVNRVWTWHFGEGLCRTPDNLGMTGERPTHPALLDWLTHRFVSEGWSLKRLHREILLSNAYQMSSHGDERAAERDPENRHWSRFNRRRLEAEEFRDAILAVSGQLDSAVGGNLFNYPNREPHVSYYKGPVNYDFRRRSLYLPVVRNVMYELFDLFDRGDALAPLGKRNQTTVAPQSLYLMNSNLVMNAAAQLAERVPASSGQDREARLRRVYDIALTRPPTEAETAQGAAFVEYFDKLLGDKEHDVAKRQRLVWQAFCQAILVSNAFLTVE